MKKEEMVSSVLPFPGLFSSPSLFSVAMRHSSWSQGFHNSLLEEQKPKHWTKQGRATQTSSHLTHTSHLLVVCWRTNARFKTTPLFARFLTFPCPGCRWRKRSRRQQVEDSHYLALHVYFEWDWKVDACSAKLWWNTQPFRCARHSTGHQKATPCAASPVSGFPPALPRQIMKHLFSLQPIRSQSLAVLKQRTKGEDQWMMALLLPSLPCSPPTTLPH